MEELENEQSVMSRELDDVKSLSVRQQERIGTLEASVSELARCTFADSVQNEKLTNCSFSTQH
jgi:hypothetical protein